MYNKTVKWVGWGFILKKFDFATLKQRKFFEIFDLFLYFFISIIILILFFSFVIFPNKNNHLGFKCIYNGEVLFSYEYSTQELKTHNNNLIWKVEHKAFENKIVVYYNNEKTQFNIISYNNEKKFVDVTESTCSTSKNCVHSPSITNVGVIICLPYNLKIVPLSNNFQPIVTG